MSLVVFLYFFMTVVIGFLRDMEWISYETVVVILMSFQIHLLSLIFYRVEEKEQSK